MSIWDYCKKVTLKKPREVKLITDTILEQWTIPAGTIIKAFETENFGWIVLPPDTQDVRGFTIPHRIFKY